MKKAFIIVSMLALSYGYRAMAAESFTIDPAHTSIVFKVSHMGFGSVYGMFGDVSGNFVIDDSAKGASSVNLSIKVDSVSTMAAKRDEHLRKPDFFDAKQFPTITFKSQSVKKRSGNRYMVAGNLTMHGVTKPVSFEITKGRTGEDPMKNTRTGGEGKFTVKRSDYGMNFMQGPNMLGDNIEIMLSVEGILQK